MRRLSSSSTRLMPALWRGPRMRACAGTSTLRGLRMRACAGTSTYRLLRNLPEAVQNRRQEPVHRLLGADQQGPGFTRAQAPGRRLSGQLADEGGTEEQESLHRLTERRTQAGSAPALLSCQAFRRLETDLGLA